MATEIWTLKIHIKGATVEVTAHNFTTMANIYDALIELEREDTDGSQV